MYRDFYRLSDEPFRVTPDPEFLFLADQHKEALAAIVYGIAKRKGFVCITGEVGVGKTTILRSYLNGVEDQQLTFVYIFNPKVAFPVLMRTILRDLGLPTDGEVAEMVERLHEHLIKCYRADRTVVLFVDEAQNMPQETLENLRMLSNLETSTDKLIQIVLVGQPELDELLSRPQLRQLRSRIVVRARIGPLSRKDGLAYIRHRLDRVAIDHDRPVFTESAMELIYKEAEGVPRIINILCDAALITGFGYRVRPVPPKVVREVIRDTFGRTPRRLRPWVVATAATAAALGAIGLVWLRGLAPHTDIDSIGALIAATEKADTTGKSPDQGSPPTPAKPADPPKQAPESAYGPADEGPDPASDLVRVVSPLPKPAPVPPAAQPPGDPGTPTKDTGGKDTGAKDAGAKDAGAKDTGAKNTGTEVNKGPPAPLANPQAAAAHSPAPPPPPVPAPHPANGGGPGHSVVVKPGDTLSKLSLDVYGRAGSDVLVRLRQANPDITDIDRLYVGQIIAFPSLSPPKAPKP